MNIGCWVPNNSTTLLRYASKASMAVSNLPIWYFLPSFFTSALNGFLRRYLPPFLLDDHGEKCTPGKPVLFGIGFLFLMFIDCPTILKLFFRLSSLSPLIWSTTIFFPLVLIPATILWMYTFFVSTKMVAYRPSKLGVLPANNGISSLSIFINHFFEINISITRLWGFYEMESIRC